MGQTGAGAGKRPTLEDVAARTGMSRSLVSLVLRGARTGATAETRERVMQAAAEIGYRPDARARLLASGESRLIGVVFGMAGRFHLELLDGLYVAAEKADYQLILSALTPRRDEREAVETLLDFRCEAAIILAPDRAIPVLAGRLPSSRSAGRRRTRPSTSSAPRTTRGCAWRSTIWSTSGTAESCTSTAAPDRSPPPDAAAIGPRCAGAAWSEEVRVVRGGISQEDGSGAARLLLAEDALPTRGHHLQRRRRRRPHRVPRRRRRVGPRQGVRGGLGRQLARPPAPPQPHHHPAGRRRDDPPGRRAQRGPHPRRSGDRPGAGPAAEVWSSAARTDHAVRQPAGS